MKKVSGGLWGVKKVGCVGTPDFYIYKCRWWCLILKPSSQYFKYHQHMPGNPLSVWLNLCAYLNSLFNCFNTPTFSLILLICLALNSSSFIFLHSAKSSSSRSWRSYEIVSGWISWTMLSGSRELGRAKKYCWSSASSSRWTIGSRMAMFHFLEWVFMAGPEQRMSTIGHWIWVKDLNRQTQDIWQYLLTIFEVQHCDRKLIYWYIVVETQNVQERRRCYNRWCLLIDQGRVIDLLWYFWCWSASL